MNILILNYEYPPLGGGAGIATRYLIKEFAGQQDIHIDLVTSSVDKKKNEYISPRVKIHYLDIGKGRRNLHYQSNKNLLIYSARSFFYAKKIIRQKKIDLIHAFFGVPCGFIAMMLGLPYIVSLRGSDVPFYNPRYYYLDKLVFIWLAKIIWKKAAFVISNSETLIELASRHKVFPENEIRLIHNGVDADTFHPDEKRDHGRDTIRILYVGRMSEVKGIAYLVAAFHEVSKTFKELGLELWLVGEGTLRERLRDLANKGYGKDKIRFVDKVALDEIPSIYNQCDIFVLPSLYEGMPLVLVEAMASGLAVVCTDMPTARELVKDGENGFIVKKGDTKDIVEALNKYILGGKKLRKNHGKISREKVLRFDWKTAAEKYLNLYKEVGSKHLS